MIEQLFEGYPKVERVWGTELILANHELYCSKILVLKAGYRSSYHRHAKKTETMYVLEGMPLVELGPLEFRSRELKAPGDPIHLPAGTWHRFSAPHGQVVILEVSTEHSDLDVQRLEQSSEIPVPF